MNFIKFPLSFNEFKDLGYDQWLDNVLSNNRRVILLFHVPVRTPETEPFVFPVGSLSIEPSDALYPILEKYRNKISLIINGHIHTPIQTEIYDIPVYLCPAREGGGCFCTIKQKGLILEVIPDRECALQGMKINEAAFVTVIQRLLLQ